MVDPALLLPFEGALANGISVKGDQMTTDCKLQLLASGVHSQGTRPISRHKFRIRCLDGSLTPSPRQCSSALGSPQALTWGVREKAVEQATGGAISVSSNSSLCDLLTCDSPVTAHAVPSPALLVQHSLDTHWVSRSALSSKCRIIRCRLSQKHRSGAVEWGYWDAGPSPDPVSVLSY